MTFKKGKKEEFTNYQFKEKKYDHFFCPVCGAAPICGMGDNALINLRTVEGVDSNKLKYETYDGASL
jgi:hypothetical protein